MSLLDLCFPPLGPNTARAPEHRFNVSGTVISFKAPNSNTPWRHSEGAEHDNANLYDLQFYRRDKNDPYETEGSSILLRQWDYHRILLNGLIGELEFNIKIFHLPEFDSLFRPRRLECAIERLIYTTPFFSFKKSGSNRLNWQVIDADNLFVHHEYLITDIEGNGTLRGFVWHLPLTDKHLLSIAFRFKQYSKRPKTQQKGMRLINDIMQSFRFERSHDALQQKKAVQEAYPYEKLSSYLPPYEYETADVLNDSEIADHVGEQLNHDFEFGDKRFAKLFEQMENEQKIKIQMTQERVLKSHLRFTELEQQDYEQYLKNTQSATQS